jgi:hypothetical protein
VTDRGPSRRTRRGPERDAEPAQADPLDIRDPFGRMALFSSTEPEPDASRRSLVVECSACLSETPVSAFDVAKAALPFSLHLPLVRRYHSFMRCPACGRRAWVRLALRS